MQIEVNYLENLRVQAAFDDFKVTSDQPIRYKGDGTAPGPFDYFLASSVLCAAYFVKVYCKARDISTNDIKVTQDNVVDPENRYKQTFKITVEIPSYISQKDRAGILASIDRCTVKKTIQTGVDFVIEAKEVLGVQENTAFDEFKNKESRTIIKGKDLSLEETINSMTSILDGLGIKIEISSWRNPVPHVWSVHIRDADCPMNYTNGKGATKESALCSALGEYLERISNNYFYADYFLGNKAANDDFTHYPTEKWFSIPDDNSLPSGMMDDYLLDIYNSNQELNAQNLVDTNSGNKQRGICTLPYTRQSDQATVYIPVNLIGNLFVSNGMSAGNTKYEARVQCLSEIYERAVKNKIITEEISLPDVPKNVIEKYPTILEGIKALEARGYPIVVKDASLGGVFPVLNVTLLNPKTGGVFSSFGAHPNFEIALERSLTELLQGRSFEGLNDMPKPTFNTGAITEPNNIVEHFIDSTGVISWRFFSDDNDYEFVPWDFSGTTEEEFNHLMSIAKKINKEVYIADYNELGVNACRILIPDYSEIYPIDDLIYDNNNIALEFRDDILNIHSLSNKELYNLLNKLEEFELDDYRPISELIGVTFNDNSVWEELTIGELKGLIHLANGNLEDAKFFVEQFSMFNDASKERNKLYMLLDNILDVYLEDKELIKNYTSSFTKMYSSELVEKGIAIIEGDIRFPGLNQTNNQLQGLEKHQKLIESFEKLQRRRKEFHLTTI